MPPSLTEGEDGKKLPSLIFSLFLLFPCLSLGKFPRLVEIFCCFYTLQEGSDHVHSIPIPFSAMTVEWHRVQEPVV